MNKQKIVPLAALALVILGSSAFATSKLGANTAHAQTQTVLASQVLVKPDTGTEVDHGNKQEPKYTSSIRIQDQVNDKEMDDSTEAKQLASLAKISSDQAKAAAEKSVGGTASSIKLEEEHGNVVYAVTLGTKEVKVDAGNGSILHTEAVEAGDSEGIGTETN